MARATADIRCRIAYLLDCPRKAKQSRAALTEGPRLLRRVAPRNDSETHFASSAIKAANDPPLPAPPRHLRPPPGAAAIGRDRRGGVSRRVPLVQPAREGPAGGRAARPAAHAH